MTVMSKWVNSADSQVTAQPTAAAAQTEALNPRVISHHLCGQEWGAPENEGFREEEVV